MFDLTTLATAFDVNGGGHANACGCRIQRLSSAGAIEHRAVNVDDVERNIEAWMQAWNHR